MTVNPNKNWAAMTDGAIIREVGVFIRHHRLEQNRTQSQVALDAGVNRWTLSQIENGKPVSLISLVQILRALDLLDIFSGFRVDARPSPIELARLEQNRRKRAGNKKTVIKPESDW